MIDNHKIKSFRGNLAQFKKSQERSKTNTTSDDFLIEFRLSLINNCLAQEIQKSKACLTKKVKQAILHM